MVLSLTYRGMLEHGIHRAVFAIILGKPPIARTVRTWQTHSCMLSTSSSGEHATAESVARPSLQGGAEFNP